MITNSVKCGRGNWALLAKFLDSSPSLAHEDWTIVFAASTSAFLLVNALLSCLVLRFASFDSGCKLPCKSVFYFSLIIYLFRAFLSSMRFHLLDGTFSFLLHLDLMRPKVLSPIWVDTLWMFIPLFLAVDNQVHSCCFITTFLRIPIYVGIQSKRCS